MAASQPTGGEQAANPLQSGSTSRHATTPNAMVSGAFEAFSLVTRWAMLAFTRQRPLGRHNTSVVRCLALGDQVLHDLGLALQPGQPRLLVHAGHLLARGQALRMTAMSWRLAAAFCSRAQVGSRSSPARIWARVMTGYGPVPWPRAAWQSAHISTVKSPSTLLKGPAVEPQKEQRSAIGLPARTDVRQMLCSSRPAVSNLSAAIPYAASRRTAVPDSVTLLSRADVVPRRAATGLTKGRAWPDTEEVTGSNPVAPTRMGLTRALVGLRVVLAVGIGGKAGYSGRRALPYLTKAFSCAGCRTCEWPTQGSGVLSDWPVGDVTSMWSSCELADHVVCAASWS
jgi:hypothetical protein